MTIDIDKEEKRICFLCGKPTSGIKVLNEDGSWNAGICDICMIDILRRRIERDRLNSDVK